MPTYTPIQSVELTSSQSTVTFTGIPQIYQDLVLVLSVRGTTATNDIDVSATFNGDSTSVYSNTRLYGDGSTAGPQRGTGLAYARLGNMTGSGSFNTYTPITLHIMRYSNTSILKSTIGRSNNPNRIVDLYANLWRSTSAITSIQITGSTNFDTGSTFNLYGISPVAANNAQAAGGTDIYYDSSYVYHVFKGSGTFTPYRNLTCDYLVVAGGGGGGYDAGGGGGAGGYRAFTSQSLTANTNYTVTIGAGGAGSSSGSSKGATGSTSTFNTNSASGGGGGGSSASTSGASGGSGGGGRANGGTGGTGNSGSYSPSEGNAGATAGNPGAAGGGGGSGSVGGANSGTTTGGAGGSGTQWLDGVTYAAGGGGAANNAVGGANGGSTSGGGSGGSTSGSIGYGRGGQTNTGSGGGGGGETSIGGSGGSGIVIVRYAR